MAASAPSAPRSALTRAARLNEILGGFHSSSVQQRPAQQSSYPSVRRSWMSVNHHPPLAFHSRFIFLFFIYSFYASLFYRIKKTFGSRLVIKIKQFYCHFNGPQWFITDVGNKTVAHTKLEA